MSLIYALIARGSDTVLVEHQIASSNFPQIGRTMLPKLRRNTRLTYLYNQNHHFHYINEQDFTYLCLCDKIFSKRAAFAFLEEIKQLFTEKYSLDVRLNAVALGFTDSFEQQIKNKIIYYNAQPDNQQMALLQNNLTAVKDQMIENIGRKIRQQLQKKQKNIDQILDREDQIQLLVSKTKNMNEYANNYQKTAVAVRRDQEWRSMKMKIFIACIIVAVILVIILIGY